jgi:hypothetical protein
MGDTHGGSPSARLTGIDTDLQWEHAFQRHLFMPSLSGFMFILKLRERKRSR